MKKMFLSAIIFCVIGILAFNACNTDKSDSLTSTDIVHDRLEISSKEFITLFNNRNKLNTFKEIEYKYGNTYKPLSKLQVSKSKSVEEDVEIDSKRALFSILNKNNVFQIEDKVVFVSQDYRVIKFMPANKYDNFLTSKPNNVFDIPDKILINEVFIGGEPNGSSPRVKSGNECDDCIDYAACVICGIGLGATACGIPAGLLELAACISCVLSLQEYHKCNGGSWS